MTTNNTNCNQKQQEVSTFCNLTEQWKKGELEEGWYYIELNEPFDKIHKDISYYSLGSFDIEVDSNYIIEVLAPVPSFQEWMRTKYSLDDYKRLSDMRGKIIDKMEESNEDSVKYLRKENQQLKELLKDCKEWFECFAWNKEYKHKSVNLLTRINSAIGESEE